MSEPDHRLDVGRITSVYGIKGWVRIRSETEPPENIFSYQPWYIGGKDGGQVVEIDEFRHQGKGFVAHIRGVDDRDVAQTYCQKDIRIDKSQLPNLDASEYYWHQLQDLKVYSEGDWGRVLLGTVARFMETGANDVLVVASCSDSIDQQERLIPWLEDFVRSVDLDKNEIAVFWDPTF